MMSIFPVLLMVLSLSITGSGRDMLDYMGTDVYWKQKSVTVTPENMLAELGTGKGETVGDISPLIKQLGDENYKARKDAFAKIKALGAPVIPQLKAAKEAATDPDVKDACERLIGGFTGATKSGQVRRLMAIRTLGELKDKSALPALQKLTDSKEQFVADYANAAIASINGTPYTRPGATAEQRASDVAMLPAEVGAVLQLSANGGQTVPLQRLLDQAFKSIGDNSPEAQEQKNRTITEMNAGILKTLEQMGNIRVDVATVGISNQVGPNQGFGVIIVRGQYDPTALSPLTS